MLLLHALLFSLLFTSTLAIPVTPVTKEAGKPSVGSWVKGKIRKVFKLQEKPYRLLGYWYVEAEAVSEHRSFYPTRY
jgi:hypothetical protein